MFCSHSVLPFCIALRFWKLLSVARAHVFKHLKRIITCYISSSLARAAVFHFYPFNTIHGLVMWANPKTLVVDIVMKRGSNARLSAQTKQSALVRLRTRHEPWLSLIQSNPYVCMSKLHTTSKKPVLTDTLQR